ncbi:MAG: hypothetical protein K0Q79_3748 [Flavipsychrobacter sp.]|nr:hypothetical protein [Flavipsychrobacter sp.]
MIALIKYTDYLQKTMNQISSESFNERFSVELDCSSLPLIGQEIDCRYHETTAHFFEPILKVNNPILYWFEIVSDHRSRNIYDILVRLKQNNTLGRNLPAYKKTFRNWDSNILYVGKVKKGFVGRLTVHLGYYTNKHTQGLQLCHWAQNEKLKLRLHYVKFPYDLIDLIGLYENALAKELHPLLGKHK